MLIEMGKNEYMMPYPNEFIVYSADLIGLFIPSALHPLFGQYFTHFYQQFTGNIVENATYVGYTVIFLVAYYILKCRKKLGEAKFWILSSAFFLILSLGPILHIMGRTHFTVFDVTVPLPYLVLYYIPVIQIARVPARLTFMLMLSLAVLAGYGIKELLKHIDGKLLGKISKKDIVVMILSLLIIFEFMIIPYPVHKVTVPKFYEQLAAEKGDYAIIEVPFKEDLFLLSDYMYYQTIHEKKLVGGYISRTPKYASDFVENTLVISNYWNMHSESDILNQDLSRIGNTLLNAYDIRYIIIHKKNLKQDELEYVETLSRNTLNETLVYEDSEIVAYEVKKAKESMPYMECYRNFYQAETWEGQIWRWMDNDAELVIVNTNEQNINVNLTFSVASFANPRRLEVRANNITVLSRTIGPKESIVIPDMVLHHDKNIVEFHTLEEPVTVGSIVHNGDTRRVILALSNVSLEVNSVGGK
jgi:hypothetical protein